VRFIYLRMFALYMSVLYAIIVITCVCQCDSIKKLDDDDDDDIYWQLVSVYMN